MARTDLVLLLVEVKLLLLVKRRGDVMSWLFLVLLDVFLGCWNVIGWNN